MKRRIAFALGAALGLAAAALAAWCAQPLPPGLLDLRPVASLRVEDRAGGLLREVRSRPDGRSMPLRLDEIPLHVRAAFIAAEDRRFASHPGVDPLAMARAFAQAARAGRVVSGASTITMQTARLVRPQPRTLGGKLREMLWALRLEWQISKDEILEQYLNRVPLGNSTLGVEAASQLYFGRTAARLSLAQAAMLAAMPRSPTAYDPARRPERARARQRWVLARMEALGFVGGEAREAAARDPLDLFAARRAFRAAHAVESVLAAGALSADPTARELPAAAVRAELALDPALQADVESILEEELERLANRAVGNAAALVVDNASGEVLAYAGSREFFDAERNGQIDGVRMLRQPGSALKPFAYGLALARGRTPATVLADLETHFAGPQGVYAPRNYDRRMRGPTRLRAALGSSFNIPAVRLAEELGPPEILAVLRAAGFASLSEDASHYGVGLVLGNGEVSLWELARAYRGLALGGESRPLRMVRRAWDARGAELPAPDAPDGGFAARRFLPEGPAALVADILADPNARAPAFGLNNALRLPFPAAAKTGTSRGYTDNWAAGFTHERTVAVWVGNFDGAPMREVSGITGAGPIFRRVMIAAMRGIARPAPLYTAKLEHARICSLSGERAGPACPGHIEEVFLPGTEPRRACPMHVAPGVLDVGPEFYAWAQATGLRTSPGAAARAGIGADEQAFTGAADQAAGARVLMPGDGDHYLFSPDLPAEAQSIPLRVLPAAGADRVTLLVDGREALALTAPFTARLPVERGTHTVQISGATGEGARATFTVR